MDIVGALVLTAGSSALAYYPSSKFGYSLWPSIGIWTFGFLIVAAIVSRVFPQPRNQTVFVGEMLLSLIPAYLFYTRFGLAGLGYSFLASIAFGLFRAYVL